VDWAALQTDVEDHANDMLQTWQLTRVSKLSREIQNLVSELKAYKDQFEKCASDPKQEWSRFWLRKSKSPVICVLLTEKDGVFKYTRGINLEVSMPTGSLCAERNAIGSALGQDPSLRREHIRAVAVLALPELGLSASHPATPASLQRMVRYPRLNNAIGPTHLLPFVLKFTTLIVLF